MEKLGFLKTLLGDELYGKFIERVGQKEGAAELAGMVAKEAQAETPEAPKEAVAAVAVDTKALTEALSEVLRPLGERVAASEKAAEDGRKVAADALAAFKTALDTRLEALEKSTKEATDGVAELRGDQTRADNKRASRSDTTVTEKEVTGPSADPENEFFSFLFGSPK